MSQHQDPVVIVSAARTPMGGFQSDFADLAAHDLGGAAIRAAVEVFQPQSPVLERLTRNIKSAFDPQGILNPGRMYASI